jgi:hypothetical protein
MEIKRWGHGEYVYLGITLYVLYTYIYALCLTSEQPNKGGDASTRAVALTQAVNDPKMAALKETGIETPPVNSMAPEVPLVARGRAGYSAMARVRTKPGEIRRTLNPTTAGTKS